MTFNEVSTVQAAIVDRLIKPDLGWTIVPGNQLDRHDRLVLIESEVKAALRRLNPAIARQPSRVDEVLPKLRAAILSVTNDGLVAANERMTTWLRGLETIHYVGTTTHTRLCG